MKKLEAVCVIINALILVFCFITCINYTVDNKRQKKDTIKILENMTETRSMSLEMAKALNEKIDRLHKSEK